MNNPITFSGTAARRVFYLVVAAVFLAAAMPLLNLGKASAAQIQSRSIYMSDSGPSNGAITSGVGSGQSVTYRVSFTPATNASSLVIDFCAGTDSPIIGDSCSVPSNFSTTGVTLNAAAGSGTVDTAHNWTITGGSGRIKIADTGVSADDITAPTVQTFTISGIRNPDTVGTFYARLYTFANTTWGGYSSATPIGNVGSYVDYGGFALSTTNSITITARVQESISFCVTKADPATWTALDCSDSLVAANPPSLTLGHGSGTPVLDSTQIDSGVVWSQLSTNATNGASITMRNSNTSCGGLSADNGATCAIPAQNGGASTAAGMSIGSSGGAQFGMTANTYAVGPMGSIGSVTPTAAYYNAGHPYCSTIPINTCATPVYFGMDTTSTDNVKTVYGSTVATTSGPVYRANDQYCFAATAGLSTPAGIYTANLSLVATGTF